MFFEGSVLEHDFRSDVGYWVHMCAHRFEALMNAELAEENVSYRQCQILAWLALEGDLSQVDLARLSGVEPSTIVAVIDRMQRDGLIERRPCPGDRRRHLITPTKAARPVWRRILKCARRVNARATKVLNNKETVQLRRLLEKVYDSLNDESQVVGP